MHSSSTEVISDLEKQNYLQKRLFGLVIKTVSCYLGIFQKINKKDLIQCSLECALVCNYLTLEEQETNKKTFQCCPCHSGMGNSIVLV